MWLSANIKMKLWHWCTYKWPKLKLCVLWKKKTEGTTIGVDEIFSVQMESFSVRVHKIYNQCQKGTTTNLSRFLNNLIGSDCAVGWKDMPPSPSQCYQREWKNEIEDFHFFPYCCWFLVSYRSVTFSLN